MAKSPDKNPIPQEANQTDIYNALAENGYKYGTAEWAFVFFLEVLKKLKPVATVVEIGTSQGDWAKIFAEFIPDGQVMSFFGYDLSEKAIATAQKIQFPENFNAQFIAMDVFEDGDPRSLILKAEVLEVIKNADLIVASYVGPSVGLDRLVSPSGMVETPRLQAKHDVTICSCDDID